MLYTVTSAAGRTLDTLGCHPRLGSLGLQFSSGWHERADRERGLFELDWGPASWSDAILQGPHLFVSTPLYKGPNQSMRSNLDWSVTDFEALPSDAIPVTVYKPAGDRVAYGANYTHWGHDRTPARNHYRAAWRMMAANTGERTLIPALMPPGTAHIHGIYSGADIRSALNTVLVAGVASSLLADFAIRSAPKATISPDSLGRLAMPPVDHPLVSRLILRTLRLNCMTVAYADLWAECWNTAFLDDAPILRRYDEDPIGPEWTIDTPLRRAADRRNAQVEIDALVALMLDVPIGDLCTIYRTQFSVLHGYDRRDYTYDANGRLVPNTILSLWRKSGEPQDASHMPESERTATHPHSGVAYTYVPPFAPLDREADMRATVQEVRNQFCGDD